MNLMRDSASSVPDRRQKLAVADAKSQALAMKVQVLEAGRPTELRHLEPTHQLSPIHRLAQIAMDAMHASVAIPSLSATVSGPHFYAHRTTRLRYARVL